MAIDPSGKFLYVLTDSGFQAFSIGPTGGLSAVGAPVVAGNVMSAVVHPSGKFVSAADFGSVPGSILGYRVNSDGTLAPLPALPFL